MCADQINAMTKREKGAKVSRTRKAPSHDRPLTGLSYESAATIRQFKHSRDVDGRLSSLCLRCRLPVASADDELKLLEFEDRHVCNG